MGGAIIMPGKRNAIFGDGVTWAVYKYKEGD